MNIKLSYFFVGLTLTACLMASCTQRKPKGGRTDTYSSGVISFASDESFSPIIEDEKQVFEHNYPNAKVKPIYTSESEGIQMLLDGKVCLVITSRDYKKSELKNLQDRRFMPRAVKLAYDGLALIINKNNTDSCISVDDIKNILNGKAKSWSDVYPKSKLGEISIVFDNKRSSAVHYIEDSLLNGKPIKNENVAAVKKTSEVISYVEKNPNAIGIIGSNWLTDKTDSTNLTFNKNIRVMRVSKWHKATPENSYLPYQYYILYGQYPLVRTIYGLLNDPINGLPWGFAHFIESPIGQRIVMRAGLLPVMGEINIRRVNVTE
jgi:phosphate transport system substrate-binding protein